MKDIGEFFLRLFSMVFIPFFMLGYALYGFRVWCWNFVHSSIIEGDWCSRIPKK